MAKRGQVSIFILLGLLIVLFIGFFLFFTEQVPLLSVVEDEATQNVRALFSQCLEMQLQEAISSLALHGGYSTTPPHPVETYFIGNTSLPYYFINGTTSIPSSEDIEEQLAIAFEMSMIQCNNFTDYPYPISASLASLGAEIVLKPTSVAATVTFPLSIQQERKVTTIDKFMIEVDSSLSKLYTVAVNITEEQAKNPRELCFSCLSTLSQDAQLYLGIIESLDENQYTLIYILNERVQTAEPRSFYFAHTFFIQPRAASLFSIASIEKQEAIIGYPFSYTVAASQQEVTFSDDSPVFDIDPKTGMIAFSPDREDIGAWIVTITATSSAGEIATESFIMEVSDVVASSLSVEPLPYFVAHVGEIFNYTVNATSDQSIFFYDNTYLFEINYKTGEISFTPTEDAVGEYSFTITVVDDLGNHIDEEGYLVVTQ